MPDKPLDDIDPNAGKILDGMREDGETLRKVDEGATAAEIALDADLGSVRVVPEATPEEDSETLEQLVSLNEQPRSQESLLDAPEAAQDSPTILDDPTAATVAEASSGDPAASEVDSPKPFDPQRLASEHGQVLHELGRLDAASKIPDEEEVPLTTNFEDLERATFPAGQETGHLQETFRGFLNEDREWRTELTGFLREFQMQIAQHRLELDEIRGYLERSR